MKNCWRLIAAVGGAFLVTGWIDVGLFWVPFDLGNAGWEFGAVAASLNGLPVPVIGTTFLLAGAVGAEEWRVARAARVAAVGAMVAVVLMAVVYGLSVPLALASASDPTGMSSITKTIARAGFQIVGYPIVLGGLVFRASGSIKQGDLQRV